MKQPIRLFSFGLMASGLLMLVIYFVNDSSEAKPNMTEEEMMAYVEEQGYKIVTNEEYIAMSVTEQTEGQNTQEETSDSSDTSEATDTEPSPENSDTTDEESNEASGSATYTLEVKEGMFSKDISSILEEQGIIDSATEFDAYLEEHGYSSNIQLGTFEVTSAMTHYELAERLTN